MSNLPSSRIRTLSSFFLQANKLLTIGEDGLSSQSSYDVRIDNPHYIESIAPNPKALIDSLPTNEAMKKSYEILVKAVNDMRIQASSNDTLSAIDRNGRTINPQSCRESSDTMVSTSLDVSDANNLS